MKLLDERARSYSIRRAKDRNKRRLEFVQYQRSRNRLSSHHELEPKPRLGLPGYHSLAAPEQLTFHPKNHAHTTNWIHSLADRGRGRKVYVDFSNTINFSASAALYFLSEVEELIRSGVVEKVRCSVITGNTFVRRVLVGSGIYARLYGQEPDRRDSSIGIPIVDGVGLENIQQVVDQILLNSYHSSYDPAIENHVFAAISEAMLNVKHHAYPKSHKNPRWWLAGAIRNDELNIAICDRGFGIPNTLKQWELWDLASKFLKGEGDGDMIGAAMTYSRTSRDTQTTGHGLGSKDIQRWVQGISNAELAVISCAGTYILEGGDNTEIVYNHKSKVDGTIIRWKIPLPKDGNPK